MASDPTAKIASDATAKKCPIVADPSASLETLPKANLHIHMTGSVRYKMILANADKYDYEPAELLPGDKNFDNFGAFRHVYDSNRKALQSREDIIQHISNIVDDQKRDGVSAVALSLYSIGFAINFGDEEGKCDKMWAALKVCSENAMKKGVLLRYVPTIVRCFPAEKAWPLVKDAIVQFQHKDKLVIALGLAGPEKEGDMKPFVDCFKAASNVGMPLWPHAGEHNPNVTNIDFALSEVFPHSMNGISNHLGHGIQAIRCESTMKKAKEAGVVFQVCPTSNIRLKAFEMTDADENGKPYLDEDKPHPLVILVRKGMKVVLGDDDPSMFDPRPFNPEDPDSPVATSSMMLYEYQYARHIGLAYYELATIAKESFKPFETVNEEFYKAQVAKIDEWLAGRLKAEEQKTE